MGHRHLGTYDWCRYDRPGRVPTHLVPPILDFERRSRRRRRRRREYEVF